MTLKAIALVLFAGARALESELSGATVRRFSGASLADLNAADFDAAVFGGHSELTPSLERVILEFYRAEKPIAVIGLACAFVAEALRDKSITLANVEPCAANDYITDREHRVISTPAELHAGATPQEIESGIRAALRETIEMA